MPDLLHYTRQPTLWVHFDSESGILAEILKRITRSHFTHCYVTLDKVDIECQPNSGTILRDPTRPSPRGRSFCFDIKPERIPDLELVLRTVPQGIPYELLRTFWWWILRTGRPPVNCVSVTTWVLRKAGIKVPLFGTPSQLYTFINRHKEDLFGFNCQSIRGEQAA